MASEATICLIRNDGRLLLQRKSAGRFGAGKWDAPGGKLAAGESPEQCVLREIWEETGLRAADVSLRGSFNVYFGAGERADWTVHVFATSSVAGRPRSGPEGRLRWFREDRLPYDLMWPSDRCWLPDLLAGRLDGRRFQATFWYDEAGEQLLRHSLTAE
jgi:8-oxo-dGTP diphosphatase